MQLEKVVLLVEDHDDLRTILSDYLSHHGVDVVTASAGAEAVDATTARRPCVVVLDLFLAGSMSGFDVARRIRETRVGRETKIIALSASGDDPAIAERARDAGCDEVHTKPLAPAHVLAMVREAFGHC